MNRSTAAALAVCLLGGVGFCPGRAAADDPEPPGEKAPSVFSDAVDGFWLGALVGSSGGYLRARKGGFESDDWKPVVMGAGIGALSGVGLGLAAGFVDLASEHPGRGATALRDTLYGAGGGLILGTIVGALVLVRTDEPEHIGFGASVGCLSGAGLGLAVGLVEGSIKAKRAAEAERKPAFRARPALALLRDLEGALVAAPGVSARF